MGEYLLNSSEPTPANKMKFYDYLPDTLKLSVIFRLPAELGKYIRICKSMAAPMRRWSQCGHSPTLRAPGTGSLSAACLWLMSGPTRATWTPHYHRVFQPLPSSTPPTPTRCISSSAPASLPWTCGWGRWLNSVTFGCPNHHPIWSAPLTSSTYGGMTLHAVCIFSVSCMRNLFLCLVIYSSIMHFLTVDMMLACLWISSCRLQVGTG